MPNELRRDDIGIGIWYAWLVALPSNLWWNGTAWDTFDVLVAAIFSGGQTMNVEGTAPNQSGAQLASLPDVLPPTGTVTVRARISSTNPPTKIAGVYQFDGGYADVGIDNGLSMSYSDYWGGVPDTLVVTGITLRALTWPTSPSTLVPLGFPYPTWSFPIGTATDSDFIFYDPPTEAWHLRLGADEWQSSQSQSPIVPPWDESLTWIHISGANPGAPIIARGDQLVYGFVNADPTPTTIAFTPTIGYRGVIPASGSMLIGGVQAAFTWNGSAFSFATAITLPIAGDAWSISAYSTQGQVTAGIAAIEADIAAGSGPGGSPYTITVETTGSVLLAGVAVWVTADAAGQTLVAGKLYTNASGQVTFLLPVGTFYCWRLLAKYNFSNPQAIVVT